MDSPMRSKFQNSTGIHVLRRTQLSENIVRCLDLMRPIGNLTRIINSWSAESREKSRKVRLILRFRNDYNSIFRD